MAQRTSKIERKTNETDIVVELNLDGQGRYEIDTGVGFFDHMFDIKPVIREGGNPH